MCYSKIYLKDLDISVPCGKCPPCTAKIVSQWSFRLMQEEKVCDSCVFLTLTYDTKHVPITKKGFMSLHKPDWEYRIAKKGKRKGEIVRSQVDCHLQQFFKRLRKSQFGNKAGNIKYFAVGEYGSKYMRPHYHAIIFNAKLELLQDAWQYGELYYGMNVSEAAVGYTLKYMSKPSKIPLHKNDDRVKEFRLMSKGLGEAYINQKTIQYHNDHYEHMHLTLPDGKKIGMPRYYKQKIYEEYNRIIFGKLGFQRMQEQKNALLSKYNLTIEEYEHRVQQAKESAYRKQIKKSAERQKVM